MRNCQTGVLSHIGASAFISFFSPLDQRSHETLSSFTNDNFAAGLTNYTGTPLPHGNFSRWDLTDFPLWLRTKDIDVYTGMRDTPSMINGVGVSEEQRRISIQEMQDEKRKRGPNGCIP